MSEKLKCQPTFLEKIKPIGNSLPNDYPLKDFAYYLINPSNRRSWLNVRRFTPPESPPPEGLEKLMEELPRGEKNNLNTTFSKILSNQELKTLGDIRHSSTEYLAEKPKHRISGLSLQNASLIKKIFGEYKNDEAS